MYEQPMDVLDITVMLRDANRSLRQLYPDYETKAESCRKVLRRIMADIPTDQPLVALTAALRAVVENNPDSRHTIQAQSLWLTAAATDLITEQEAVSVHDKAIKLIDELGLSKNKKGGNA